MCAKNCPISGFVNVFLHDLSPCSLSPALLNKTKICLLFLASIKVHSFFTELLRCLRRALEVEWPPLDQRRDHPSGASWGQKIAVGSREELVLDEKKLFKTNAQITYQQVTKFTHRLSKFTIKIFWIFKKKNIGEEKSSYSPHSPRHCKNNEKNYFVKKKKKRAFDFKTSRSSKENAQATFHQFAEHKNRLF